MNETVPNFKVGEQVIAQSGCGFFRGIVVRTYAQMTVHHRGSTYADRVVAVYGTAEQSDGPPTVQFFAIEGDVVTTLAPTAEPNRRTK